MHPPKFLHQGLSFTFVFLSFGFQDEIKTGEEIYCQERRDETAQIKMDASQKFHLLNLAGERNEQLLANKQPVGFHAGISLEHLTLCDAPRKAFGLEGTIVRL